MGKRILEYPEVTTITDNDYVLLDNAIKGTRRISVYDFQNPREVNYNWYFNEDKSLVVREKISDGSFRWYWNNYNITKPPIFMPVPDNLTRFIKNSVIVGCEISSITLRINIGFYDYTIRAWSNDLSANYTPKGVKCIMESTDTGWGEYYHEWEEPTFDPYTG